MLDFKLLMELCYQVSIFARFKKHKERETGSISLVLTLQIRKRAH